MAKSGELKSIGYEIFIGALSVLSIVNLVLIWIVEDTSLDYVMGFINLLLSAILFGDFCLRLWTAPNRGRYFLREYGWADLLASVPLPQLKVLRVFRLARVYRLMRDVGVRRLVITVVRDRAGSALLSLLLIAILVLEFGSLEMLSLEASAPGANITTASDALWYMIVTMSTVGYGDQYPVTNPGRMLGSIVIIIGVGIFGTLTGYLANAFLAAPASPKDTGEGEVGGSQDAAASDVPAETAAPHGQDPRTALEALRAQHLESLAAIDRMLSAHAGAGADGPGHGS